MSETLRRVLLVRTDRIGDVVLTTPAASILKELFPGCRITFLTRKYTAPLLRHYPAIDEILIYRPLENHRGWRGHLRLSAEVRQRQFDAAVLFYPTASLAAVLFWAGIPRRIGIRYRWYSPMFLNYPHSEHRKFGGKHELEFNLSLLQHLPGFKMPARIEFQFTLQKELTAWLEDEISGKMLSHGFVCIHPGSGGSAPNLSTEQYRVILRFLLTNTSWKILLTGAASERVQIDEVIRRENSDRIFNTAGEYTLEQLMGIISRAKLLVASSTGAIHIANAFRTPILSFFCPATPTHPDRWGPYHQREWAIMPEVAPCKRGIPERCPYHNCLSTLPDTLIESLLVQRINSLP